MADTNTITAAAGVKRSADETGEEQQQQQQQQVAKKIKVNEVGKQSSSFRIFLLSAPVSQSQSCDVLRYPPLPPF